MDTNGDGKVGTYELLHMLEETGEEYRDEMQKFKTADENGDDHLDHGELHSFLFPENHGGVLQLHASAVLKKKDADGDGSLSLQEMFDFEDSMDEHTKNELVGDFEQLDVDHNELLNLNELMQWESGAAQVAHALQQLFEMADQNDDGYVTVSELQGACTGMAGSRVESILMEWAAHHEL